MRDSPLRDRVRAVCDDALGQLVPGPGRDAVAAVRRKLDVPLTVTVAGGVSSGKSTLVNALLGQRIAAVDAGECTRVVTEFRYDAFERVEVQGVDGAVSTLRLERGRIPEHLGRPAGEIRSVVVYLSNALLTDLAVVDTPGLNTVTEVNEASTASFLGVHGREGEVTASAIGQADALVFLLPMLRQADADVLRGFAKLFDGSGLTSASTVAVLSKVDRLSRDRDPVRAARPIADRVAAELRGVVSSVLPVVGLLAETARAAVFTEDDARAVLAMAEVDDEMDREDMLLSAEDFLRFEGLALDLGVRRRLLSLLDVHGLAVAIAAADAGAKSASAMLRAFETSSGFGAVRTAIVDRFGAQADAFKAHAAMSDLRRASYRRDDPDNARALRALRSPLERLELDPAMHRLRLLTVAEAVSAGQLALPPDLLDDLVRLAEVDDPSADAAARSSDVARAGAARWATWGNDARRSPDEARHARVVKEAFEVMFAAAQEAGR